MAALTVADRICQARRAHQDSIQFASEFWDATDLLMCLSQFAEKISFTEIGTGGPSLEIAISLRRLVTENCLARWGPNEEKRFRELNEALYHLHETLHTALGTVTWSVHAAALRLQQEIGVVRLSNSL